MAVLAVHRRTSPAARATTWPTMASWRRYDAPPTNLQRLMYGLLTDPLLNGTAGGM